MSARYENLIVSLRYLLDNPGSRVSDCLTDRDMQTLRSLLEEADSHEPKDSEHV